MPPKIYRPLHVLDASYADELGARAETCVDSDVIVQEEAYGFTCAQLAADSSPITGATATDICEIYDFALLCPVSCQLCAPSDSSDSSLDADTDAWTDTDPWAVLCNQFQVDDPYNPCQVLNVSGSSHHP